MWMMTRVGGFEVFYITPGSGCERLFHPKACLVSCYGSQRLVWDDLGEGRVNEMQKFVHFSVHTIRVNKV